MKKTQLPRDLLRPSIWRTCRALANRRRLGVFQSLLGKPGLTVKAVAEENGISRISATQCLRSLNSRGLLRVSRSGRWVEYSVGHDPSVPATRRLVAALSKQLADRDSMARTFRDVTAFTHPRRVRIVRLLARGKEMSISHLCHATGISVPALYRHLRKLVDRGVVQEAEGKYGHVRSGSHVLRTLTEMILG
jgi:DNA-binding transcriptional ArsR family regulator